MSFEDNGYKERSNGDASTPGGNGQGNYQQRQPYQGGGGGGGGGSYGGNGGGSYGGSGGGSRGGGNWSGSRSSGFGGGSGGFQRKPEGPPHIYKPYVIYAGERTPQEVQDRFSQLAAMLESRGYTARLGGQKGLEMNLGRRLNRKEEILPFKGFNDIQSTMTWTPENAKAIAEKFEPGFQQANKGVQIFLAQNVRRVYGHKLDSVALFMLMWSEDGVEHYRDRGQRSGQPGHIAALASNARIPVFNFGNGNAEQRLMAYLDDLKDVTMMEATYAPPSTQQAPQQPQQPQQYQGHQQAAPAAGLPEMEDIGF